MNEDYNHLISADVKLWNNYAMVGNHRSILSNRVSYTFDLRGPSVALDTACSGAMVCVNLGIKSILNGKLIQKYKARQTM
jgi:polyketide synthase 13